METLTAPISAVSQTLALRKRTLDLSKEYLTPRMLDFIVAGLPLANIRSLNLSHNNLLRIPDCFFRLINLTCLYVNDNSLSSLPESMILFQRLEKLDLRNNQLKELDVVRKLHELKNLSVEGNPLTRKEIRSLIKRVNSTTRRICVDIAGSVARKYGNE